jgi:sn-1 stearoyl-lipid 9-desaturase
MRFTNSRLKYHTLILLLVTAIYLICYNVPYYAAAIVLFSYFCFVCLGNIVMFHKYLAHNSYKTSKWVEYLFTLFGTLGGVGSSLTWVTAHYQHHKYSDTAKDPHSPHNGIHKLLKLEFSSVDPNISAKRLMRSKYHMFLDKYYYGIHAVVALVLLIIGGPSLLVCAYTIPALITIIGSIWLVNILSHTLGYRNFNTKDKSTNNVFAAIIGFGEGWHNNHHHNPKNPNFGVKWWEIDLSYQVIKLIRI